MSNGNDLIKEYLEIKYAQLFKIIDDEYDYDELKKGFDIDMAPEFNDKKKKKAFDLLNKHYNEAAKILNEYKDLLGIDNSDKLKRAIKIYDYIKKIYKYDTTSYKTILKKFIDGDIDDISEIYKYIKEQEAEEKTESRSYNGQYSAYSRNMKGVEKTI